MPRAATAWMLVAAIAALAVLAGLSVDHQSAPVAHSAAGLPPGFADAQIADGISDPSAMALADDGRIFVAEQSGDLRVIKDEAVLPTPFASVDTDANGERGLLGVALDPDFANNQFVYVYYTATTPTVHNRVTRFTANGDVAAPGSEVAILDLDDLSDDVNHNGGAIHFGIDGKLYVAVGENHNGSNAQTLDNRLGKMLRINADGSIPTDNPFFSTASGANRAIWALGLRNPFTFGVQPGTGRLFINDVGEDSWEEINDGAAGANYGWPDTEGETSDPAFVSPLLAYPHGDGPSAGCAITGGAFYNPQVDHFPAEYVGDYFFADFCSGWIRRYDPVMEEVFSFASAISLPVDVQVGPDGRLYYLERGSGSVRQIRFAPGEPPSPLQTVTFDDVPGQNQVLNGEHPLGVIDWGFGTWWHSEPWGAFTTKSVTFNGAGISSGSFALFGPRMLVSLDAYNGGAPSTVTLSCAGQTDVVVSLASDELRAVETGWTQPCGEVTITSTNGWDTNFDNLLIESGELPPDSDGDGCTDVAEQQTAPGSERFGGRRDPQNFWDFFDTPNPANVRDGIVSASDIVRIVERFGATGTATSVSDALSQPPQTGYHAAFDRTPPAVGADLWNLGPADGTIAAGDISRLVLQFGHSCA